MNTSRYSYFLVLFCAFLLPDYTYAKHIIGGEITYEYLGDVGSTAKRWRFTMKIYRDCNSNGGADFDNPAEMAIYKGSYFNNSLEEAFNVQISNQSNLSPIPPECVSSLPPVCVQQATYIFEKVLPVLTNQSYFIVYQRCCRNVTITNVVNPGDIGATYSVELNPQAMAGNNDSPVYTNFPPIIICNNFPIDFDHSAIDSDGDLLVYKFCSPFAGGGKILVSPDLFGCEGAIPTPPCAPPFDNVPFDVPTFSPGNPMGGNPQVSINPTNGFISGSPNLLGQFVVGVCVDEFRNGQLLSTVRRDFQFNVADCMPTVLANIKEDTILGPKRYVKSSCGNKTVTFVNESVQQQFIDEFKWTFDLKNGMSYTNTQNWDATVTFPDTGFYTGTLLLNPGSACGDTAYIFVNIFPGVNADFEFDYDTCVAGPVTFTDLSSGDGIVNRWKWRFGVPNGESALTDPLFTYPYPGNHPVKLTVSDKNRCVAEKQKIIPYFPVPPYIIIRPNSYIGCAPGEIFFDNLSSPLDENYYIVWNFGDGDTLSGVISPSHVYNEVGTYDVSVAITSPLGCFISDTFPRLIRIEPSPTANFSCDPDSLLSQFNNTVKFTDLSVLADRWNWTFDKYGSTTVRNPTFSFPDTGKVTVRLIVTHPEGCQDSMSKVLDIRPEIRWYMPNAFTPNADGTNDGFLGKGILEGVTQFQMTIWNRWGEMVFETNNPVEEWNGRQLNKGGMSAAGVYVYHCSFTGPRGEKLEYKGFATLVK